jgi:glyoxylase-like metal-dependent hydrolase (beta-lactamase superfamily II)
MTWGYPEPTRTLPIPPVIRTDRFTFDVIHTPGHSADHVVLWERCRGWCFSGDVYAGKSVKGIRPEEDMATIMQSLLKLTAREEERLVLLTSLGRIYEDGREALASFMRYIEDLSQKACALSMRGRSVQEIVVDLFGGEEWRAQLTNGQFTTENLIRSVLKMHDQCGRESGSCYIQRHQSARDVT